MIPEDKKAWERLIDVLRGFESLLVAFSGGVDSSLLLAAATKSLPGSVIAVSARSPLNPPGELDAAREVAKQLEAEHLILDFNPLSVEEVAANDPQRCYHCKKALMIRLKEEAQRLGLGGVVEGSHAGDAQGYRPGRKALLEEGISSPLAEAGLDKEMIRRISREVGLPNWDRPSQACLATRFPYDTRLDLETLNQVFQAEKILDLAGLAGTRARHHGRILRLEISPDAWERMVDPELRRNLVQNMAGLGFDFVTLDLAGYRSGVFDADRSMET